MVTVLVTHPVDDYENWKSEFDAFHDNRKASGELTYHICQPIENPNNLIMLFEWDSIENAENFFDSTELRSAMKRAGVIGPPEITFMQVVDYGST